MNNDSYWFYAFSRGCDNRAQRAKDAATAAPDFQRYSLNALIVYNSSNPTHRKGLKWQVSAPADTT